MSIYRLLAAGAAAAVLAGCTSSSSPIPSSVGGSPPPASSGAPAATSSPAHHHRHHHHQAQAAGCDAALWAHVYHPDRLHVIRQCMTVRGTVTEVRWEPDGDLHIRLATRPALVNAVNDQYQAGDLVLEEICQGQVSQADAEAACQSVPHNLAVPAVGDKITVTGSYVLDANHGWLEIHPVTRLTVTGQGGVPSPTGQPAAGSCHPTTPSGNCYEPGEFCSTAEHGQTGVAGDGKTITCKLDNGYWRWE